MESTAMTADNAELDEGRKMAKNNGRKAIAIIGGVMGVGALGLMGASYYVQHKNARVPHFVPPAATTAQPLNAEDGAAANAGDAAIPAAPTLDAGTSIPAAPAPVSAADAPAAPAAAAKTAGGDVQISDLSTTAPGAPEKPGDAMVAAAAAPAAAADPLTAVADAAPPAKPADTATALPSSSAAATVDAAAPTAGAAVPTTESPSAWAKLTQIVAGLVDRVTKLEGGFERLDTRVTALESGKKAHAATHAAKPEQAPMAAVEKVAPAKAEGSFSVSAGPITLNGDTVSQVFSFAPQDHLATKLLTRTTTNYGLKFIDSRMDAPLPEAKAPITSVASKEVAGSTILTYHFASPVIPSITRGEGSVTVSFRPMSGRVAAAAAEAPATSKATPLPRRIDAPAAPLSNAVLGGGAFKVRAITPNTAVIERLSDNRLLTVGTGSVVQGCGLVTGLNPDAAAVLTECGAITR